MGERIAISFVNGGEKSVVLWSHFGDKKFLWNAQRWVRNLEKKSDDDPITRREPCAVVAEFMRSSYGKEVDAIVPTFDDAWMPDHGFWEIDLYTGQKTEVEWKGVRPDIETILSLGGM